MLGNMRGSDAVMGCITLLLAGGAVMLTKHQVAQGPLFLEFSAESGVLSVIETFLVNKENKLLRAKIDSPALPGLKLMQVALGEGANWDWVDVPNNSVLLHKFADSVSSS